MKLVATKTFSYNTRRLNPGDVFEAKDPDGRLLVGVLKARKLEDRKEESIAAPKKDLIDKINSGSKTDTKIPASFVGETPDDTPAPEPKVEEVAPEKEVIAPVKVEEKEVIEPAKVESEKTPAKPNPANNKGRGKN